MTISAPLPQAAPAARPLTALPRINPMMGFDEAVGLVLGYLRTELPMAVWMLNQKDGDRVTIAQIRSDRAELTRGDSFAWGDSLCARMLDDGAPPLCSDVRSDPHYSRSPALESIDLHSYAGVPLTDHHGDLYGTLCGLDFDHVDLDPSVHLPLLELLAGLLGVVLSAERARVAAERYRSTAMLAAHTDGLTGLYNRRAWEETVCAEQELLNRVGDPGSVVIIDLDGLKLTNDRYGHAAGDDLLRRAAAVLQRGTRQGDVVARIGGDEFAILLVRGGALDVDRRAESILAALADAGVAASIGTARFDTGTSIDDALAAADGRMYDCKRGRRGLAAAGAG